MLLSLAFFLLMLIAGLIRMTTNANARYALFYGINADQIFVDQKPRDCSFWTAPVGDKGCHYERSVIVTHKDGTVSSTGFGSEIESLTVAWDRVEE